MWPMSCLVFKLNDKLSKQFARQFLLTEMKFFKLRESCHNDDFVSRSQILPGINDNKLHCVQDKNAIQIGDDLIFII